MNVYLAAGWFTPDQEQARQEILEVLTKLGIPVFSPKEDLLYEPGKNDPMDVFLANLSHIRRATLMIASTEGKDMGTIFECGYAYAKKTPILYYYKGKGPFNLMLAESGVAVAKNQQELDAILAGYISTGVMDIGRYRGDIE